MFCGQAQCTINRDVRTACHSQRTIGCGVSLTCYALRFTGIQCIAFIEGNQQGNTAGNGVVPRRQSTVVHQNNSLVVCILRHICGCVQVAINQIAVDQKMGITTGHNSLNGGVRRRIDRKAHGSGHNLVILIHPAQEAVAGGSQGYTFGRIDIRNGDGGDAVSLHRSTFHRGCNRTIGIGILYRDSEACGCADKGHIRHNQLILDGIGISLNDNGKDFTNSQTLGILCQTRQTFAG